MNVKIEAESMRDKSEVIVDASEAKTIQLQMTVKKESNEGECRCAGDQ